MAKNQFPLSVIINNDILYNAVLEIVAESPDDFILIYSMVNTLITA